jgi:hypothetical protein
VLTKVISQIIARRARPIYKTSKGRGLFFVIARSKKHEAAVGPEVYHSLVQCAQALVVEGTDSRT